MTSKYPDAVYVVGAYPKRRHFRGWRSDDRVLCFWWTGRHGGDDVYQLPVCGRCLSMRGAR